MGFRFQRRINLGGGWGVNASGSGGSLSYRDRSGSIGTKGYSIRTGIPGLSYRGRWGKSSAGGIALVFVAIAAFAVLLRLLWFAIPLIWGVLSWVVLTSYDLGCYGVQRFKSWRTRAATVDTTNSQ
jgi:hypothetical protein